MQNTLSPEKCRYADKYKAVFPPRCNNGNPCLTCSAKWKAKGDARFWPRRHRLQFQTTGGVLDPRTSKRFAREFEAAVKQRGAEAKAAFEASR